MKYRRLGDSELLVSCIGYGCWEMGGTYGAFDKRTVITAIHRAIDLGVNLFDTARAYGVDRSRADQDLSLTVGAGRSEELLAQALGPRRQSVLIVTKGGLPTRYGQKPGRDSRRRSILDDCESSLRSLHTDYIDLYLIHWPDRETPIAESMSALSDLVSAGKVRHIGVCNFGSELLAASRSHARIVANQVGYNLFDRRWEREMFDTARGLGVGIMAYGPLAHGLLTGTFTSATTFDKSDWRQGRLIFGQALLSEENFMTNLAVVDDLRAMATEKSMTLPQLALAWVLTNPLVATALTGGRTPAEVKDSVGAADITLDADDCVRLDAIMANAAGQVANIPE